MNANTNSLQLKQSTAATANTRAVVHARNRKNLPESGMHSLSYAPFGRHSRSTCRCSVADGPLQASLPTVQCCTVGRVATCASQVTRDQMEPGIIESCAACGCFVSKLSQGQSGSEPFTHTEVDGGGGGTPHSTEDATRYTNPRNAPQNGL